MRDTSFSCEPDRSHIQAQDTTFLLLQCGFAQKKSSQPPPDLQNPFWSVASSQEKLGWFPLNHSQTTRLGQQLAGELRPHHT